MSSLKYEVDSRKKTARDLEEKLGKLERRHWDAMSKGEDSRKDLEQKNKDKTVENEGLKKKVDSLERKVGKVHFFTLPLGTEQ